MSIKRSLKCSVFCMLLGNCYADTKAQPPANGAAEPKMVELVGGSAVKAPESADGYEGFVVEFKKDNTIELDGVSHKSVTDVANKLIEIKNAGRVIAPVFVLDVSDGGSRQLEFVRELIKKIEKDIGYYHVIIQ